MKKIKEEVMGICIGATFVLGGSIHAKYGNLLVLFLINMLGFYLLKKFRDMARSDR